MTAIPDTITYLEMFERPPPLPGPPPLGRIALMRAESCTVSFYRYLYETVGTPWVWFERRLWSDEALAAELAKETTEIFVLYAGGVPAGYFELNTAEPRDTELCYFGLAPEFIGRRLGPFLLNRGDRTSVVAPDRAVLGAYLHLRPPAGAPTLPARRVCRLRPAPGHIRGPTRTRHPAALTPASASASSGQA